MAFPTPPTRMEKLPLATKLAYGAGDLGPAITANLLVFFLLPFFTDVAGLRPAIAGTILLISKIWDAVNDPIVGVLIDRYPTPWGRRRPWMFLGAIPFGLTFAAQWWVPFPGNELALAVYYIAIAILFNTFYTVVNLPYTALTPELTQDYDERTSLNNYRFAFSIGGSILSAALHLKLVGAFDNPALGWLVAGGVWALASTLPIFWCVWGTRERFQTIEEALPFWSQFAIAFRNRPYLYVIGIYICSWLAVQGTATIIPYYITYWMRPDKASDVIALTILAVQGTAFAMLFVWSRISAAIGKRATYVWGMSVWIAAQFGLFFLQPGQIALMYVLAVMAGVGVAVAYLIPWSMIPDVIDLDELHTGQRREGIFYGFMVLLQKVGLAIALFLVGVALDAAGFVPLSNNASVLTQPESVLQALRGFIGPVPTVCLILGIVLAARYPITKSCHHEILTQVRSRSKSST